MGDAIADRKLPNRLRPVGRLELTINWITGSKMARYRVQNMVQKPGKTSEIGLGALASHLEKTLWLANWTVLRNCFSADGCFGQGIIENG